MYKFGLVKDEGVWNTPSTDIYYGNYFQGYKPLQSYEIFGLISSTDNNFWMISEDDDHYWTTAKVSEETVRSLKESLENYDFSTKEMFSFVFDGSLLLIKILNLEDNKIHTIFFDKTWIKSLIQTLDIDNPVTTTQEVIPVWEKSVVPDKIDYPIMTPEEYVYHNINMYPLLYANKDFDISKFKVIDHLFNTLGNGCRSIEDFEDSVSKKSEIDIERAKRFCVEEWSDGYSEVETFEFRAIKRNLSLSTACVVTAVFEEEKSQYPEAKYWFNYNSDNKSDAFIERKGFKNNPKFKPYPNFQKTYSIIWNEPEVLNLLSDEWKKELLWFYETSIEAINDNCFQDYNQFPTGSTKEDDRRVVEMGNRIKGKSIEEISKDYETEFTGDIREFLTKRWLKTKEEYISFITETISLLKK